MGHTEQEISAAFSQFDGDGNQVLDAEEQERMKRELEEKRDALSAELNNLGQSYEKESVEKASFPSRQQESLSNQSFVDQQQFQRLARQVLQVETSVADLTSRMELMLARLGLRETAEGEKLGHGAKEMNSRLASRPASDVLVHVDREARKPLK